MGQAKAVKKKKKKQRRYYDYSLLFTIIFLMVFGLIMIYSSSSYNAQVQGDKPSYYMSRQAVFAMIGFVAMLVISKMNYHLFARFAMLSMAVSYICMILVNFTPLGVEVNGKKRWLGTRSIRFQPAELVKITVILVMAVIITKMGKEIGKWGVWWKITVLIAPVGALVLMNNLSSGIIIFGIAIVMMFIANNQP